MIELRKYRTSDRDAVRKICIDTGAKSFQKKEDLRESLALMFVDYYLDFEPENVFVADDEGQVCGYIVTSTNKKLFEEKCMDVLYPKIKKIRWWLGVFFKICTKSSLKMDEMLGGGGFHINIDEAHQGNKLGPKLLTTMGVHLKKKGFKYLYLITKNRKTRGYSFYSHYGFEEICTFGIGQPALAFSLENIKEKVSKYLS